MNLPSVSLIGSQWRNFRQAILATFYMAHHALVCISCNVVLLINLQGCTKRWALGCVKLGGKVVFCLPSADRRTQIVHLIFTQPGAHLLVHVENVTTVITPPLVRYSRCAACESVSLTRRHRLLKGEQGSLIIFHSTSTVHTAPLSNLA